MRDENDERKRNVRFGELQYHLNINITQLKGSHR